MFGVSKYLIIGGVVLMGTFASYFLWSQHKIETQAENLIAHEITIQTQELALDRLGVDIESIKLINKDITRAETAGYENRINQLNKLRKLEKVARAKPSLVENIINKASNDRARCIEVASGSSVLNNETNRVCPHIITGNE